MSVSRRSRVFWSIVDQGASSASNLLGVIVAARLLGAGDFGRFAIVYGACLIVLGLAQAIVSQPLVLIGGDDTRKLVAARSAFVLAGACGVVSALGLAAAAAVFGGLASALLAAAALMPFVLLQDSARFVFSTLGRMHLAALSDLLWLALLLGGGLVLSAGTRPNLTCVVVLWCGAGAVAGLPGVLGVLRLTRGVRPETAGFRSRRYLGYRFVAEFTAVRGANQLMAISLGWLVSAQAAGALRGVATLYGPVNVLVQAVTLFGAPVLVGMASRRRSSWLVAAGAVMAVVALGSMLVLIAMPASIGRSLLGSTWELATPGVVIPLGVQAIGVSLLGAALLGVRLTRPQLSLPVQLASTFGFVICFSAGVASAGLRGAAWGFGIGTILQAALTIAVYLHVTRDVGARACD